MESFRDSSATDALVYVQGQSEATGQGNLIAPDYAKRPIFEKAGPNERVTISFERRK